ncbi:nitronate monooxygenase [Sulfitobacter sp. F26169L]|uniref:NAD(P)H-dependent flavin oxidoreductase n=1 Tax=Sulfitobacter sp. F26169L TaxID=2996015 RepID=UPI00226102EA|nr:nitronate monooxygenase [Sulfitobacter sp. F26169L]MCX7566381.1 nitronate monooxygenase [Sulfitobacter sp. F26169L]
MNPRIEKIKSGLALPAIAAPMFLVSNPQTVIAACKAGVMGSFPGPNARTSQDLRAWLSEITTGLGPNDAPWAMNMITHSSYGRFDEEIALVEEFQPDLVITALGGPHRVTEQVHAYGGQVFADVTSPKFARKALEKGADGLVLVCAGAGGHTGEYAMLPFIDEVRTFFDGPLIVGGGIGTGRAIRAVENLGADFAYLGTRFLATEETMISQAYREMVWQSTMEDLVTSRAITGALGNWMRASIDAAGLSLEDMQGAAAIDFSEDMHDGAKAWKHVWSAGQGVGTIAKPETIAEAVATLLSQYEQAVVEESQGSRYLRRKTLQDGV